MPLILLGLILLIGLLAYSIVRYLSSGETDDRPVRERYPQVFSSGRTDGEHNGDHDGQNDAPFDADSYVEEDSLRGDIDHILRNLKNNIQQKIDNSDFDFEGIKDIFRYSGKPDEEEDNTVEFPRDNIENEKRKRGINTDK